MTTFILLLLFPYYIYVPHILFYFLINLFIYFWLCWVFIAAHRLSLVVASGGYSSLRCAGFSLQWLLLLQSTGSRRAGFSSCGARAQLLHSMWDLPGSGLEPVSPALAGRFLTTVPPGKSPCTLPILLFLTHFLLVLGDQKLTKINCLLKLMPVQNRASPLRLILSLDLSLS